ncbi:MAG: hypothetical protein Q9227_003619 [Pyrenula ochraceoflavens]
MMHPARQAYVEEEQEDVDVGVDLASLPVDRDYELPSTSSGIAPERASAILSQFDRKRRAAQLAVPTDDGRVRSRLRELGEPITLFGEGPADRRDRLRELLLSQLEAAEGEGADVAMEDATSAGSDGGEEDEQEEEFYTMGSQTLLDARRQIAKYSLPRAKSRVAQQRQASTIPLRTQIKHRKTIKSHLSTFDLYGTQIAGDRPVSITRFSPSGGLLAAGNWSGGIKLLTVPNLEEHSTLRGHTGMVGGLSWLPGSTLPSSHVSPSTVNLASGAGGQGSPNTVNLWSLTQDTPLASLSGHTDRVCRVEFHPSGTYLASASFDTTWRLWDIPTQTELLLQEGHSRPVYALSHNADGSLLASGGFDSMGRIWDLRTGRTVMILDGHIREIYAVDWGADGYRVLTGSGDGWVKCWDIRAVRQLGGLGAHKGNVADLRWFTGDMSNALNLNAGEMNGGGQEQMSSTTSTTTAAGTFFVTAGFDKNVNVFSADDWALVKTLSGHSGNVLSCDVSQDAKWIASCGHDRTVKVWGMEEKVVDGE